MGGGGVNQLLFVLKHFQDDLDIRENLFELKHIDLVVHPPSL
jgi:hypothetical protein